MIGPRPEPLLDRLQIARGQANSATAFPKGPPAAKHPPAELLLRKLMMIGPRPKENYAKAPPDSLDRLQIARGPANTENAFRVYNTNVTSWQQEPAQEEAAGVCCFAGCRAAMMPGLLQRPPATESPTTEVPPMEAPATEAPTTETSPTTEAPAPKAHLTPNIRHPCYTYEDWLAMFPYAELYPVKQAAVGPSSSATGATSSASNCVRTP